MYKGNPGENDFGLSWRELEVWAYERSSLQYIGSRDFYDLFPFLVEGGLPTNVFTWQKIKLNWNTNHYPVFSLWPQQKSTDELPCMEVVKGINLF